MDDDCGLSGVAKLFLEKIAHYNVEVVNDPCLAVSRAQEFHPDAMLFDVDMPGKDGGELAAEMGAHPTLRNIPILFFTGLLPHEEAGKHEVIRGGMPFLAKPLNPNALVSALRRVLAKRGPLHGNC